MARGLGLVGIVAVAACGGGYRKLDVAQVQSVAVAIDEPAGFCAYGAVALRALVTYKNGKQAQSQVPGESADGRLRASEFQWGVNHGSVDDQAVLRLSRDPLEWFDAPIEVTAHVTARPEIVGAGSVEARFDCGGTVDLRGAPGARGGESEDGGPGAIGPAVDVALAYLDTQHRGRLVLVRTQRGDDAGVEYFVIDAAHAQKAFVLDARGGDGGRGGQGVAGFAGRAGAEGVASPDGTRCSATDGEPGGPGDPGFDGGAGGPGGQVTVHVDPRFPELRALVEVRVEGGDGGVAGGGGTGGDGGAGGAGCNAAAGARGPDGASGRPGVAGPPGEVHDATGDIATLFAAELERGLPVVGGTP